jgi:hypothetical protein
MTSAEDYRINAAACLRLAKTMNENNKRRLEQIARQWLDLAQEADQKFLEAAE